MRGSITVTKSAFISNGVNKTYWGGNALFNHYDGDKLDCSETSTIPFALTVESSYFMYGETTSPLFTARMQINILDCCSDIHIVINNSVFLGNHHHGLEKGGNLELMIQETHNSTVSQEIIIDNSYIAGGRAHAAHVIPNSAGLLIWCARHSCEEYVGASYLWKISNSQFIGNVALFDGNGGIMLGASCISPTHQILLYNNTFTENKVRKTDHLKSLLGLAHLNIITKFTTSSVSNIVSPTIAIRSCTFQRGIGGGIHIGIRTQSKPPIFEHRRHTLLQITDAQFLNNNNEEYYLTASAITYTLEHKTAEFLLHEVEMNNCTFENNSNPAMIVFFQTDALRYHSFQPFAFIFQNIMWKDNWVSPDEHSIPLQYDGKSSDGQHILYNAVMISNVQNATFIDCEFQNNQNTALTIAGSFLHFKGTTLFKRNNGINGGAIQIYNSFLFLKSESILIFINNSASIGGAIYVQQDVPEAVYCFFQLDIKPNTIVTIPDIATHIIFEDNTAMFAGSALYGGDVDKCMQNFVKEQQNSPLAFSREAIFDQVFNYSTQHGLSVIASDPVMVCFCNSSGFPDCFVQTVERDIFPGESYNVSAVVAGQRYGVVPGSVITHYMQSHQSSVNSIDAFQRIQSVSHVCSNLTFTVSSTNNTADLMLETVSGRRESLGWYPRKIIKVLLKPCPLVLGFELSKITGKCDCAHLLSDNLFTCAIQNRTVHWRAGVWIGYHFVESVFASPSGVLLHKHCPFDYCKQEDTDINLEYPDEQCAFNRSGVLCGACPPGLSLALGTSRCLPCSNAYIAMFLVFALAGILLVLLLILLNLTVSEGTLSGLIFYANIVHVNQAIFFRSGDQASITVARVFVAWLNLDLGIETCFCDGMDMYVKTWLQFIFPIYVWLIVLVMIVSGHYSTTAARLFSRNAVKVLATLFLLAYAKLQRTIVTAISYTSMVYPDSSRRFHWLYDGNIRYLHGKHIPLFMAGVLAFLLLSVPYTLVLFFLQCLMKSQSRVFFWVNKWKPLFDAYTGPFKDKYRFWTGLLLAFRSFLFVIFAFNVEGDPAVNLLSISLCAFSLCGVPLFGIYKSLSLNILEFSFILNLGTLSTITIYILLAGGNQVAATNISIGVAFATFIGIILYHMYKRLSTLQLLQSLVHQCRERRQLPLNEQDLQLVDLATPPPEVPYSEYHEQPARPPRVTRMRLVLGENNDKLIFPNVEESVWGYNS